MKPKVIKTKAGYEAALERIDQLFDAKAGTPEGDELELLGTLVEVYEKKNFPIEPPDAISAIRFRMEQLSRAKLLVCHCCRFYGNPSGDFRLRDLDRCSLVDFRKPRSIPLKAVGPPLTEEVCPAAVKPRSQRHALGKAKS